MLIAAVNPWLLPATLFFDAFSPAKTASTELFPLATTAQRIRHKRKVIRSKRGY
jgi:hypothetical protein